MEGETKENKTAKTQSAGESAVADGKLRNGLIFGSVGLFAAIVFGLLYIFVISPSVPEGSSGWSTGWFLFSFAAGLTMIVLPCTLPLAFVIVPLSMGKGLLRGISMALAFGIGVTVTLSIYGILAALLGGVAIDALGADLEVVKNWVYFVAGIFALVFALSEIGLMNVHMPTYSGAAPAFIQKKQEIIKAFLLGLFLGNIGVGCPHPATPLILIEIASSGDVLYGWLMFLVHAIGRVLPLLLLAFLAILGVNGLNWLLARKTTVERVTGWAMVFVAGFILTLGLFTHGWWVNSGIHTQLEAITQESKFNEIFNENFDTAVAHVHGPEEGVGLFGQPLEWGHWFLVLVWLIPIWWWWMRKRKELRSHPSFKLKNIEKQLDSLEKDRRQVESMVNLDELEAGFDLSARHAQLDTLENERRKAEEEVQYGETGEFKNPVVQSYEHKIHKMHRNYLLAISIFLALTFVYFLPENFYFKSISGVGHDDHGATGGEHAHAPGTPDDHAHGVTNGSSADGKTLEGVHVMADGTVMNALGETFPGAHVMPDGMFMFADGTTYDPNMTNVPINATLFSTSLAGLPFANDPETVELNDGDTYDITAYYVQKEVGNRTLRMLSYNGSVPGPFIKVDEGAEITINFTNNSDLDQTIHSHGVRIDNNSDGVPNVTQDAVGPGGTHTYTVKFADGGVYWYHPHTRDDYGQEMGLYGNYLVEPETPYPGRSNREVPLVIDDILIENEKIVDFYREITNFALLGRLGDEFLVNGEENYTLPVQTGEVIRFFVTNVSNARTYNLSIPGAQMKLVAADIGRYERETFVDDFLISPAERMVVEVYFEEPGIYSLMHTMPSGEIELTRFVVSGSSADLYSSDFNTLHTNQEVIDAFADFRSYTQADPDKKLLLTVQLEGQVDHSAHTGHAHGADTANAPPRSRLETIQWEDPGATDKVNTTENVTWKMIDQDTGMESMMIPISDWTFKQGNLVKIRLTNDALADHVMQHPIHLHGQRFVVLSENGVPNTNLAWKDTVLVFPGEVVDILVDMSNLGEWMSHCHISEHLHAGMMLQFRVENENGYATGDEYRALLPAEVSQDMNSMDTGDTTAMAEMMDPNAPAPLLYNFSDSVSDTQYFVTPSTRFADMGKDEIVTLTFSDVDGNAMTLDESLPRALSVTFVSSDNSVRFVTYPGNTQFPNVEDYNIPGSSNFDESLPHMHDDSNAHDGNVPGTPGFDESMPHTHSLLDIPVAYAHGGVDDGHVVATGGRTYSVPVRFPTKGNYRGFTEFTLAGESSPRIASFDMEVGTGSSVNNLGWSQMQKWWILLIASILLMIPLVLGVRKYIGNTKV